MYRLSVESDFSSAHQLRGYKGKCENLHGHNWKVVMTVKGTDLNSAGLLIDFHELKKILKEILEDLDHKNINDIHPFTEINPSSENISKYIAEKAAVSLAGCKTNVTVDSITVWESAGSRCEYRPE